MKKGGKEAFLHHLLTMDLSNFDVRKMPKTRALTEQKLLSLSSIEEWWFRKLENGMLLQTHTKWTEEAAKERLISDYLKYAQMTRAYSVSNATAMGMFLKRVLPTGWPRTAQRYEDRYVEDDEGQAQLHRFRPYFWLFPPLDECRARWEENFNNSIGYSWPTYEPNQQSEIVDEPF